MKYKLGHYLPARKKKATRMRLWAILGIWVIFGLQKSISGQESYCLVPKKIRDKKSEKGVYKRLRDTTLPPKPEYLPMRFLPLVPPCHSPRFIDPMTTGTSLRFDENWSIA